MDAVSYGFASEMKGPNGCGKTEVSCVCASPKGGQKIEIGKHVFCNRAVNMKNIVVVGFNMDYTIAQYKPETFESLAYTGTVKKLVANLGYPNKEIVEYGRLQDLRVLRYMRESCELSGFLPLSKE